MSADEFEKVFFRLDVNEDGYPPVGIESLNAKKLSDGTFQLDNTPFFVEGIALGDIVSADLIPDSDERYWFDEVLAQSDNQSLSIILIDNNSSDEVALKLKALGCYCEYGEFGNLKMLAVSVLSGCNYNEIFEYLEKLEDAETLSFAELAIG